MKGYLSSSDKAVEDKTGCVPPDVVICITPMILFYDYPMLPCLKTQTATVRKKCNMSS